MKIIQTKKEGYIAELPEFDIFTEADNPTELDFNINDLIYTFFDIPKKYHGKIVYRKIVKRKSDLDKINTPLAFKVFCTPELYNDCLSLL